MLSQAHAFDRFNYYKVTVILYDVNVSLKFMVMKDLF